MSIATLALRTASATGIVIGPEVGQKTFRVYFQFTLLGTYPTAGDTFDLGTLFALTAGGPGASFPTGSLPDDVRFRSVKTPGATALFEYHWAPGTTLANGKIQVFTGAAAQSGLAELSAGAYPAGVLADLIRGEAVFPKL